jgi:hypothetical protein
VPGGGIGVPLLRPAPCAGVLRVLCCASRAGSLPTVDSSPSSMLPCLPPCCGVLLAGPLPARASCVLPCCCCVLALTELRCCSRAALSRSAAAVRGRALLGVVSAKALPGRLVLPGACGLSTTTLQQGSKVLIRCAITGMCSSSSACSTGVATSAFPAPAQRLPSAEPTSVQALKQRSNQHAPCPLHMRTAPQQTHTA